MSERVRQAEALDDSIGERNVTAKIGFSFHRVPG